MKMRSAQRNLHRAAVHARTQLERHPWMFVGSTAFFTATLCVFLFYFTPLHFVNLIDPPVRSESPSAVYAKIKERPNDFLFIDVRTPSAYEAGHAEGSVNIPIHDFYDDRRVFPRAGKTIVLICGDSKLAGVAYGYLQLYGFHNLVRVEGGLAEWKSEGLPTVSHVDN